MIVKKSAIGVFLVSVSVLFCAPSVAFAWQVTVQNDTQYYAKVNFWGNHLFWSQIEATREIDAGASVTVDTGGICPSGFSGQFEEKQALGRPQGGGFISYLAPTSILTGGGGEPSMFTACCWNSSWRICRKRNEGGVMQNEDFGFCKQ